MSCPSLHFTLGFAMFRSSIQSYLWSASLHLLVSQFRRGEGGSNDKESQRVVQNFVNLPDRLPFRDFIFSTSSHHSVAHELIALHILVLLLEKPTLIPIPFRHEQVRREQVLQASPPPVEYPSQLPSQQVICQGEWQTHLHGKVGREGRR